MKGNGFDVDGVIQRGTLISLDAAEMLSTIMVNGVPDRILFFEGLGALIESAAKAVNKEQPRVSIFGECCGLLYAEGKVDVAISIEKIGNHLGKTHNIDILCGYPSLRGMEDHPVFKSICAEHSAVSFR